MKAKVVITLRAHLAIFNGEIQASLVGSEPKIQNLPNLHYVQNNVMTENKSTMTFYVGNI